MDEVDVSALFLPKTVFGSPEWVEIENKENAMGPDQLLDEIINKKMWSNVEIAWVLKRLVYFYGNKKSVVKNVPTERMMMNMNDILRVFYVLFDKEDPEIDDNMRSYVSTKLADATWGVNSRTREYLYKLESK
ncbi:MAG: hypothetical protein ACM3PE_09625 [Deltaproteobacteria bacterium]